MNINQIDNDKKSAIWYACDNEFAEITHILLEYNCDTTIIDGNGNDSQATDAAKEFLKQMQNILQSTVMMATYRCTVCCVCLCVCVCFAMKCCSYSLCTFVITYVFDCFYLGCCSTK